jgi:hypothetical protein
MSSQSDIRSGVVIEATLQVIMKCLDALEDKMQSLQSLQDKVDALEEMVHVQEEQQLTLHTTVECVDTTQRGQGVGHPSPHDRCRTGDGDDEDQGGDFLPTLHKLKFPKFDGIGDPLPWLNQCKRYFHVRRTPEHKCVVFAAFYLLDDVRLWFHWMELNGGQPTWPQFINLINARFGPPLTDSPIGELVMLRKSSTVDDYNKKCIVLS